MRDHPRPLLLVDEDGELIAPATRVLGLVGPRTLMPLGPKVAQQYLCDAASVGRLPVAAILRLRPQDDVAGALADWISTQPTPIGGMPVRLVTDALLAERAGPLEPWLQGELQRLLV